MALTIKDVEHVAKLTRIRLTAEEKERYGTELSSIIGYFDKLNELDTSNTEITYNNILDVTELRADAVEPSLGREALLTNAPEKAEGAFLVPSVVE
ncbi:MAG: Asp-tRNA(Asn)/Glu-tRNA(Gln) amidotransferase subunit GatC [Clostridiales bacterium]|jgi:aspartyl-tRNA(Asn)/glutamyl-tRNA(Gln) amidotransferase subunit C|nr:Asp-tRNA(Asn)/Glu-tRNA(Gln) amidotransferase subunit GatC [Clostridiales bacterium]